MERKMSQHLIIRQQSSILLSIIVLLSISACATPGLQDSQLGLTHLRRGSSAVNDDLCKASHDGNFTAVRNLIAIGADVNARHGEGATPLIYSAIKGHTEIAKFLIDNGADVNAKDNNGWTALAAAAHVGYVETVKLLIERGADVNAVEKDGYSVLMATALILFFPEKLEIVKLLINKGADVNARSKEGWTALMEAAKGHAYLTKGFIDKGRKDVAMVPTEFAKLLIERGSEVNARDMYGRTALMTAADNGQTETIKLLLEKGANVNANDIDGNTALMYSIAGYASLMKRLSKAKLKDDNIATIPAEIATLLINKGIDVNAKKKDGVTALMIAASAGITEIVRLLIEKGADINAKTNDGLTAYYLAATNGHTDIAKLLEQAGGGPVPSPIVSLKGRLRFEGFSIFPPQINNWSSMDSDTKGIILERYTGKKIHTILASVRIKEYTDLTIKGRLELLQYVKEKIIKENYKDARFKPIDIKVSSECYLGGDCVRYDFTIEDHGAPYAPGSILILTGYGFFVVHPDANYIVDINYNQRFPKGDKPLPVEDEVEPFFKSLEFTPIKQKSR